MSPKSNMPSLAMENKPFSSVHGWGHGSHGHGIRRSGCNLSQLQTGSISHDFDAKPSNNPPINIFLPSRSSLSFQANPTWPRIYRHTLFRSTVFFTAPFMRVLTTRSSKPCGKPTQAQSNKKQIVAQFQRWCIGFGNSIAYTCFGAYENQQPTEEYGTRCMAFHP